MPRYRGTKFFFRVISVPHGHAPEEIRTKWIGRILPCVEISDRPTGNIMQPGFEVDPKQVGGYVVEWENAMLALMQNHPEAVDWWAVNIPQQELVFNLECGEVLPDTQPRFKY